MVKKNNQHLKTKEIKDIAEEKSPKLVLSKLFDATLVILTKNEITGLKAMFNKIPLSCCKEVFAIDAQSKDGTVEFFKRHNIRVVNQEKLGRAEAFRIANAMAKYDNIIYFSPDGNEDPRDIPKLLELLEQGYDMAVASRFMKGARSDDQEVWMPIRGFGNKGFTWLMNILWQGHLTDSINGFRAMKRDKFLQLAPDSQGFGIEFQLSIRALKLKYKIAEIPTYEGDRIGGESTARTFATGWYFIKLMLRELWLGKKFLKGESE